MKPDWLVSQNAVSSDPIGDEVDECMSRLGNAIDRLDTILDSVNELIEVVPLGEAKRDLQRQYALVAIKIYEARRILIDQSIGD